MAIDHVQREQNKVIINDMVEFDGIQDMKTHRETTSHLLQKSAGFRSFVQDLLRQLEPYRPQPNHLWWGRSRFRQGRGNQSRPCRSSIFNTNLEPLDGENLTTEDVNTLGASYATASCTGDTHRAQTILISSSIDSQHHHPTCCTIQHRCPLMFYPVWISNKLLVHGLIDSGAVVSIVFSTLTPKVETPILSPNKRLLCANKTRLPVTEEVKLLLKIGSLSRIHQCCVCDAIGHEMILGMDFLKAIRTKLYPTQYKIELAYQQDVPCLAMHSEYPEDGLIITNQDNEHTDGIEPTRVSLTVPLSIRASEPLS